jgi:hypothetical protein
LEIADAGFVLQIKQHFTVIINCSFLINKTFMAIENTLQTKGTTRHLFGFPMASRVSRRAQQFMAFTSEYQGWHDKFNGINDLHQWM